MPDIQCPICNKKYKDRISYHLRSAHNIAYLDAEKIKELLADYIICHDTTVIPEIKELLSKNGFRFEKLRIEEITKW